MIPLGLALPDDPIEAFFALAAMVLELIESLFFLAMCRLFEEDEDGEPSARAGAS